MPFDRGYRDLDADSAPPAARPMLAATRAKMGFVPSALSRMALAPALPRAFQQAIAAFDGTSLEPVEREVVILTMACEVGCEVCVAMHARALGGLDHASVARALIAGEPTGSEKLDALAAFTRAMLASCGDVEPEVWSRFLAAGYSRQHALEVVLGLGAYTMSTYANRLTNAPIDPQLRSDPARRINIETDS